MTLKKLKTVVHHEPFRPYMLKLNSGEEIVVRKARKSSVSGDQVALVGECRRANKAITVERFRIIPVDQISNAVHLDVAAKE